MIEYTWHKAARTIYAYQSEGDSDPIIEVRLWEERGMWEAIYIDANGGGPMHAARTPEVDTPVEALKLLNIMASHVEGMDAYRLTRDALAAWRDQ